MRHRYGLDMSSVISEATSTGCSVNRFETVYTINVADFKAFELEISPSRYSSHPLMCVCAGDIRETMAQELRHITWKWRAARTSVLTLTLARDLRPRRKCRSYRSMTSLNFSPTLFTGKKNGLLRQLKL